MLPSLVCFTSLSLSRPYPIFLRPYPVSVVLSQRVSACGLAFLLLPLSLSLQHLTLSSPSPPIFLLTSTFPSLTHSLSVSQTCIATSLSLSYNFVIIIYPFLCLFLLSFLLFFPRLSPFLTCPHGRMLTCSLFPHMLTCPHAHMPTWSHAHMLTCSPPPMTQCVGPGGQDRLSD